MIQIARPLRVFAGGLAAGAIAVTAFAGVTASADPCAPRTAACPRRPGAGAAERDGRPRAGPHQQVAGHSPGRESVCAAESGRCAHGARARGGRAGRDDASDADPRRLGHAA